VLIGEAIFGDRSVGWWVFAAVIGSLIYQLLAAAALRLGLNANDLKLVTAMLLLAALAIPQLHARVFK
jgi:putative tryptophan/tyrosine transport system permease protein